MTQLSPSGRSEEDLIAVAGSRQAAYSYVDSVDPLAAAKKFSIPSFHFYGPGHGGSHVGKLSSILKDRGLAFEMSIGETAEQMKAGNRVEWRVEAARYAAVADFIDKSLAAAPP